jgi:hypothetical protein
VIAVPWAAEFGLDPRSALVGLGAEPCGIEVLGYEIQNITEVGA